MTMTESLRSKFRGVEILNCWSHSSGNNILNNQAKKVTSDFITKVSPDNY